MTRSRGVGRALAAATVLCAVAATAVLGWAGWQAFGPQGDAAAQQRAAVRVERAWAPAAAPRVRSGPPVAAEPRTTGATIATIRVPRFGRSWVRTVRQGVDADVLDSMDAGVGHYPGSAMPGGVGNFAVAAHDSGWGSAFRGVVRLRAGDEVRVEDASGVFTYTMRNLRWVPTSAIDVLLPVPERPDAKPGSRVITLTTCDPPFHAAERLVAYGTLTSFVPRRSGTAPTWSAPGAATGAATGADVATLAAAVRPLAGRPMSAAAAVRAVRDAGLAGRVEVTQDRTFAGRPAPQLTVAVGGEDRCAIAQVAADRRSVAAVAARAVAGRCLLGAVETHAAASSPR